MFYQNSEADTVYLYTLGDHFVGFCSVAYLGYRLSGVKKKPSKLMIIKSFYLSIMGDFYKRFILFIVGIR